MPLALIASLLLNALGLVHAINLFSVCMSSFLASCENELLLDEICITLARVILVFPCFFFFLRFTHAPPDAKWIHSGISYTYPNFREATNTFFSSLSMT